MTHATVADFLAPHVRSGRIEYQNDALRELFMEFAQTQVAAETERLEAVVLERFAHLAHVEQLNPRAEKRIAASIAAAIQGGQP